MARFRYSRWWWPALVLAGLVTFRGAIQAAEAPLSLDGYWQKVRETQALVARLEQAPPGAGQAELMAAAEQWAGINMVVLPDDTRLPVDHSFLVAHLRAEPPELAGLGELLQTLLAAGQAWPPARHTAGDTEIFHTILARPEFQWQPSFLADQWQQFWDYVSGWLRRWLPENHVIVTVDDSLLSYGLLGLGLLALVIVLAYALRGLLINFVTEAEARLDVEAGGEILTADTAFKRAQSLSGAGDYRTAVRYLYLSSLLLLEERGLLRYDRSRTNREYLRHVAQLPQLALLLQQVIDVFDRVWYGYQPLDEASYRQYAAQVERLRQQK